MHSTAGCDGGGKEGREGGSRRISSSSSNSSTDMAKQRDLGICPGLMGQLPLIAENLAIRNDEELYWLMLGVTISQGGVLPNIHAVLLPKKTQEEIPRRQRINF
ncbi:histone H2A type 1 [Culex quinquefasciatus]|uniref:Histone H2A n=1 Tax=Culex quinquefasciatus TaxID=7176 RepID=B0WBF5_CULQU|nr:histone H2A type 1 [Culex quinquefasciatus]|eukprot:XP_001846039.1 histone H2A type 1 [Culex quinquefasciatus]